MLLSQPQFDGFDRSEVADVDSRNIPLSRYGFSGQALTGDLYLWNAAVLQNLNRLGAGLAREVCVIGTAVVEYIPLSIDTFDSAVDGA